MAWPISRSGLFLYAQKLIRGFLLIPTLTALAGVMLAIAAVWLDRTTSMQVVFDTATFLNIDATGARAVLSTIAGAMMTVLSLVYSLTLVVFTLAAANIGPRLLETFTDNRVNQTTIGLLGATFLYALIVLYIVGDEEVPKISVAISICLAAISFFWLVYFVHDVAQRVMVDNEIGRTQRKLRSAIDRLLAEEPREQTDDRKDVPSDGDGRAVAARRSGYVTAVDVAGLRELAERHDGFIDMKAVPGSFVIDGAPLAVLLNGAKDIKDETIERQITIEDARAPEGDIQFNVHLNVEIALRALSPGINDAYTAISCIDHLSASLARILQRGAPTSLIRDDDGTPRVWLSIIEVKDVVGAALHPLRRAARTNMLVGLKLIEAIGRMRAVARSEHLDIIHKHLRLIATDMKHEIRNPDDRKEIAEALWRARSGRLVTARSV